LSFNVSTPVKTKWCLTLWVQKRRHPLTSNMLLFCWPLHVICGLDNSNIQILQVYIWVLELWKWNSGNLMTKTMKIHAMYLHCGRCIKTYQQYMQYPYTALVEKLIPCIDCSLWREWLLLCLSAHPMPSSGSVGFPFFLDLCFLICTQTEVV